MRPAGFLISSHLALGAIWVWDPWASTMFLELSPPADSRLLHWRKKDAWSRDGHPTNVSNKVERNDGQFMNSQSPIHTVLKPVKSEHTDRAHITCETMWLFFNSPHFEHPRSTHHGVTPWKILVHLGGWGCVAHSADKHWNRAVGPIVVLLFSYLRVRHVMTLPQDWIWFVLFL